MPMWDRHSLFFAKSARNSASASDSLSAAGKLKGWTNRIAAGIASSTWAGGTAAAAMASAMLVPLMVPTFSARNSSSVCTTRWGCRVRTTFRVGNTSTVKQEIADVAAAALAGKVTGTPTVFVGKNGTKPQLVGAAGSAPTGPEVEAAINTALAG